MLKTQGKHSAPLLVYKEFLWITMNVIPLPVIPI